MLPLYGGLDEDPLLFAEIYAEQRCAVCGAVGRSAQGKSSSGRVVGDGDSDDPAPGYAPACDTAAKV